MTDMVQMFRRAAIAIAVTVVFYMYQLRWYVAFMTAAAVAAMSMFALGRLIIQSFAYDEWAIVALLTSEYRADLGAWFTVVVYYGFYYMCACCVVFYAYLTYRAFLRTGPGRWVTAH